jgi:general secretion pathway protein H
MRDPDSNAGFTLLEVSAVVLIVALVAALAIAWSGGTGHARLKAVALEAAALFRRERVGAILTGSQRNIFLDGKRRALVSDAGDSVTIPTDVTVNILGSNEPWIEHLAIIRFQPDGASSGAVVRLSREGVEYEIRINWFTGSIAVESR